jgi:Ca2+-transporting ATPase
MLTKLDIELSGNAQEDNPENYFKSVNYYYSHLKIGFACNSQTDFKEDGKETATYKTDLAFTKFLLRFKEPVRELRKKYIREINGRFPRIPFSSKRKKMSTVVQSPDFPTGYRMYIKGASEIIVTACSKYLNVSV